MYKKGRLPLYPSVRFAPAFAMGSLRAREFSRAVGCLIYVFVFGLLVAQCACSPARPSGGGGSKKNDGSGSPNSNVSRFTRVKCLVEPLFVL